MKSLLTKGNMIDFQTKGKFAKRKVKTYLQDCKTKNMYLSDTLKVVNYCQN